MFLGRDAELKELNKQYGMKGFRFVVIYGRRRVGKTALIAEFVKDKDSIFYIAIERNDKAALAAFSDEVFKRFPPPAFMPQNFESWEYAFEYIADQAGDKRVMLAIDEYPYLASGNHSISSILQKVIDTKLDRSNIFLILCGSSMSFMQNQVLGYESPLYGRRSAQLHIEPFDYLDAGLFFRKLSPYDKMLAYAVCGGIPQYLKAVSEHGDLRDGIYECFFKKTGILYEEPENLLKQELREPAVYNTLISSIANGASKLNEISTKAGEESKKSSKYLKSLLDLQIICKERPHGVKAERNSVYRLNDNMFRFWYRYIPKYVTNIESGHGKQVWESYVLPDISAFIGRIFEDACREYMLRQNGTDNIPFFFNDIGRWWGTNPETKGQEEIDIIAAAGSRAMFGESKWTNADIGIDVLNALQTKSMIFGQYSERRYILFSKAGFSKPLIEAASKNSIKLVSLEMLYNVDHYLQ